MPPLWTPTLSSGWGWGSPVRELCTTQLMRCDATEPCASRSWAAYRQTIAACVLALLFVETCAGEHSAIFGETRPPALREPCFSTQPCRSQEGFQRRRCGLRRPLGTRQRWRTFALLMWSCVLLTTCACWASRPRCQVFLHVAGRSAISWMRPHCSRWSSCAAGATTTRCRRACGARPLQGQCTQVYPY